MRKSTKYDYEIELYDESIPRGTIYYFHYVRNKSLELYVV